MILNASPARTTHKAVQAQKEGSLLKKRIGKHLNVGILSIMIKGISSLLNLQESQASCYPNTYRINPDRKSQQSSAENLCIDDEHGRRSACSAYNHSTNAITAAAATSIHVATGSSGNNHHGSSHSTARPRHFAASAPGPALPKSIAIHDQPNGSRLWRLSPSLYPDQSRGATRQFSESTGKPAQ